MWRICFDIYPRRSEFLEAQKMGAVNGKTYIKGKNRKTKKEKITTPSSLTLLCFLKNTYFLYCNCISG